MSMSILAAAEEDANPDAKLNLTTIENPSTKDSDEKVEGMNLEEPTTFTDPAILAMKSSLRYSRDKLLQLRQVPLSQKRPDYLNAAYNNTNGTWDPEMWHRSRSDTPSENGVRNEQPEPHKRRSGDPRERIRKEQDGIVLSPQRRSFNSGCFVPLKENQRSTNRPHSPLGKTENSHLSHRELPPGARRIGSGRILSREVPWDFQEKSEGDNDFGYRRERREVDREDRFDRRSFSREYDVNKDKEKHGGRNNGRYNDRRRFDRDEEPEWFSGGPMSQHETIELRGFDDADCDKTNKKKLSAAQKKRLKERSVKNVETHQTDTKDKQDNDNSKSFVEKQTLIQQESSNRQSPGVEKECGGGDGQNINKLAGDRTNDQTSFNIDDILKCETIAGLLSNGVGSEEGEHSGSRFSRWFKRDSPIKQQLDSRRSSLQDEQLIKNLLNDIAEPNVSIPVNSDLYFTPISPAANTNMNLGGHGGGSSQKPFNLFEMLQRGKQPEMGTKNMDTSKVLSLEELEARMMHQGGGDPGTARIMAQNKQMSQKPEDDSIAFKRMLAHAVNKNGPVSNKNQPMSILEMLSHSQQQDEVARLAASQIMGPTSPNPLPSSHVANDLAYKLQQVQNHVQQRHQSQIEMLSKIMSTNIRQQMGTSPLPEMGINQSRELLSRPEAQAILQGLKRGDITPQHLYQQLAGNAAMQPRHRELLLAILKLHGNGGAGVGPSPRVLSPVPPHSLYQQQQQQPQQQLCVSPLPNAMHQRIPSPRELQVHTQNIMQRALIKKKLEEQQENFKKRQEMQQRGQSPGRGISPAKHTSSPTPLAFTPTSVLRKMTAEKDDDSQGKLPQGRPVMGMKPTLQQQHNMQWNVQQLKQPAGRPIVKANPNLQSSQSQQDQQQFYQQQQCQQQQQQQQRLYGQQQHQSRKISSQFPNQPGASSQQNSLPHFAHQQSLFSTNPQQFQQLTQHQLRAQHQQHQPPQQQKQQYNQQQNHQSLHWSHQQLLMGHNFDGRSMGERGGASNNGGDLSPTSNQLARWFSPELLERARAGKVPHMPSATAAQHAISLEEIERQTAPPVHN